MQFSNYQEITFSAGEMSETMKEIGQKVIKLYIRLPSIELFTTEILSSILKQIKYYYSSGFFTGIQDAITVCDSVLQLVGHLKTQAEPGYKFQYGTEPESHRENFVCYYNDLILTDNTILFSSQEENFTYITTNAINLMKSDHPGYFQQNLQWARNIINRSTLISNTGERERNKFFREITFQIQKCRLQLES